VQADFVRHQDHGRKRPPARVERARSPC
jgi:hypothetical protein